MTNVMYVYMFGSYIWFLCWVCVRFCSLKASLINLHVIQMDELDNLGPDAPSTNDFKQVPRSFVDHPNKRPGHIRTPCIFQLRMLKIYYHNIQLTSVYLAWIFKVWIANFTLTWHFSYISVKRAIVLLTGNLVITRWWHIIFQYTGVSPHSSRQSCSQH